MLLYLFSRSKFKTLRIQMIVHILAPVPDAVQQVTMQANSWDGENYLGSSVLVQVTTKSGTNQFHGTGSMLYTNQNLSANPAFFSPVQFQRKDVSAALGGPVIKDKLFFFADVEALWSKVPSSTSTAGSGPTSTYWETSAFDTWATANFPNTTGTTALTLYPASKYLVPNGTTETAARYFYPTTGVCPGGATTIPIPGSTVTIPCNLAVFNYGSFSAAPPYNATQYNFRGDWYPTSKDRLYLSYYNDSFNIGGSAGRESKIEDKVARSVVRKMGIGENYERKITSIRSNISRLSRGTSHRGRVMAKLHSRTVLRASTSSGFITSTLFAEESAVSQSDFSSAARISWRTCCSAQSATAFFTSESSGATARILLPYEAVPAQSEFCTAARNCS